MNQFVVRPYTCLTQLISLVLVNIISFYIVLPIWIQLIFQGSSIVYIGVMLSAKVKKGKKKINQNINNTNKPQQLLYIPLVASINLIVFYVVSSFFQRWVILIFTIQFTILGIIILTDLITPYLRQLYIQQTAYQKIIDKELPLYLKFLFGYQRFQPSKISLFVCLLLVPIGIKYSLTKHWFLNNLFSTGFAISAIKGITINSFKYVLILIWILLLYDIFWVYGTDIMLKVAKNFDIPIKLEFPLSLKNKPQVSMLGLGDLILPGIVISSCLKYEIDKAIRKGIRKLQKMRLSLFFCSYISFIIGLGITYLCMVRYEKAQPALLFIVPCMTFGIVSYSIYEGQLCNLLSYQQKPKQISQKTSPI